jgi:hypothetical protein
MFLSAAGVKILTIFYFLFVFLSIGAVPAFSAEYPIPEMDPNAFPAPKTGCLASSKCHAGIEPIRAHNSGKATPKAVCYARTATIRQLFMETEISWAPL